MTILSTLGTQVDKTFLSLCASTLMIGEVKSVPQERRGAASSMSYIAQGFAGLLAPAACGFMARVYGYTPAIWLLMPAAAALCAVSMLVIGNTAARIEVNFNSP